MEGKYGITFTDVKEIPGGLVYNCNCLTDLPFSFLAISIKDSFIVEDTIRKELGLVDFKELKPEKTEVVKANPEYWKDFVADANLTVVVARKP